MVVIGALTDNPANWMHYLVYLKDLFENSYSLLNEYFLPALRTQLRYGATANEKVNAIKSKGDFILVSIRSVNIEDTIISKYAYELFNGSCSGVLSEQLKNW